MRHAHNRHPKVGDTVRVDLGRRHKPLGQDPETLASHARQAQRATGERTVKELRDGPRGLTLLLLDNGREYDAATGLQHNSEETLIVQLHDKNAEDET